MKNGNRYWACKDKKKYKPACKGWMTTTSSGHVSKVLPHCHSSSLSDVRVQQILSSLRTTGTEGKPSMVVRKLLLETPASVKCHLPVRRNLLKRVTKKRRRERGYPTCIATCAREYVIPMPTVDERKGGLILLDDTFTPNDKRVVGITSRTILHAINQSHRYLFLDGTFEVTPKYFRQVWIVHGFVLDSAEVDRWLTFCWRIRRRAPTLLLSTC